MRRCWMWLMALVIALTPMALAEDASIGIIGGADGPTAIYVAGTVQDGLGRQIEISQAPERIISLSAANTEILYALGVGDKIIGVDAYSDYPEEALSLEQVGDYSGPNVELITSLEPDVIFASTTLQIEAVEKLEELGFTVVCNEPTSYEQIYEGIMLVAAVVGADPTSLIEQMRAQEQAALARVPEDQEPLKVYYALSFGEYGDYSAGPGTFIDDMLTMAGAENVAGDSEYAWPMYSGEAILAADPDVVLVSDYMHDGSLVESFKTTAPYSGLRCVEEGRVYAVNDSLTGRPGPRIVDGLEEIVDALYGEE